MSTLRFLFTFVALLVIPLGVLAAWQAVSGSPGKPKQTETATLIPQVGLAAPDFDLPDLNGMRVRLSDFRGKPVVIVFWADWCSDCQVAATGFNQLHTEGLPVLGINLMEPRDTARAAVRNEGIRYPVVLDRNGEVARMYGVQAIPNVFVLDANGVIVEHTFSVPQNRFRPAAHPGR